MNLQQLRYVAEVAPGSVVRTTRTTDEFQLLRIVLIAASRSYAGLALHHIEGQSAL